MRIQLCTAALALSFLTACSGLTAASGSGGPGAQAIQQVNIDKIKASVTNAQTALQDAQTALGTIFNSDGSFNWSIFVGGVDFTTLGANTQTCLQNAFPKNNIAALVLTAPSDIATALKCILDDVATVAGIANTDMNTAMSTLEAAMSQVPAGSPQATEIQAMITEIQSLETGYSTLMTGLASQLSVVTTFLNTLPTLVTGAIPVPVASLLVGMTVSAFVQPIVFEVLHFQQQLAAL